MKRTGFTLIELLVVIAVIALLLALTTAALRKSRLQAKAVLCRSNVRQLTVALFMYADQNETFPFGFINEASGAGDYLGSAATDRVGLWWLNDIEDFVEKPDSEERVFSCPSKKLDSPKLQRNILWGNYGVNRSICRTLPGTRLHKREFTGTPLGRGSIPRPSQTLLIVDSGYSLVNWWHVTDVPPCPPDDIAEDFSYVPGLEINAGRPLLPAQRRDAIAGRHPNKTVNVGFADGQVGIRKAQDLFVENAAETYRNRTPLWVPK
ncbi:MAG: type II secretion system protein [Planctomycetota bacterium]|jgi:prepilin-type N-terminal cleavage/methylation domain-containing protein/prepilin-type processing-associated H-X9-DG protein